MRYILSFLLLFLPQWTTSSGTVNIPVPQTSFHLGYGQTVTQTLNVTPSALQRRNGPPYAVDGVYLLKFSEQNYGNSAPKYPGNPVVEIDFGTQELCEYYSWGTANVTDIQVVCTLPAYLAVIGNSLPGGGPVQGAQPLVIHWSGGPSWEVAFTNVSLTFTPQPCQTVANDC
jgi:hypothetical protein